MGTVDNQLSADLWIDETEHEVQAKTDGETFYPAMTENVQMRQVPGLCFGEDGS